MKEITMRYKIWEWALLRKQPVTTCEVERRFEIPMNDASRFLGRLYGEGYLIRERISGGQLRFEYSVIADRPPHKHSGNGMRPVRGPRMTIGDDVKRIVLKSACVATLVSPEFLLLAREIECSPLVSLGAA